MSSVYEDELRSEQDYVTGLYARLDVERARVKDNYRAALLGDGESLADRDADVRALAREVK